MGVEIIYNLVHRKFHQLEIRCGRENQHPAEWAPRPPVEQPRRTGKKRGYGHKSGGQYVAVLIGLQLPLTVKPLSNPFEPFQIKWEVYFSKELCRSSLLCRRYDSACICIWVCNKYLREQNHHLLPKIQGVSIYMSPMWLLITLLIIMRFFFVSELKIAYYNNY